MYYSLNTPAGSPASWVRFATETDRDDFTSRKPESRRTADAPTDVSGFQWFRAGGLSGETRRVIPGEIP